MPRLVTKFKYLKPGAGGKSVGGYARYIATREGVERIDDSHRHAYATQKQQVLIEKILRDFPDTKQSHEYRDYQQERTVGNASEFISTAMEEHLDAVVNTKTYADYIATRPRAERFGSHGLFTDDGVEVQLSEVSKELNAYRGNVYTAILSLKREDAARLGFDHGGRWRDFLRGQTPTLSENLKIPMNHLRWYAAFHNEGHQQLRVAAYCRVSTEEEGQQSSYEAQCTYYTDKIMTNPEWTMAGIFADEGISGTSTKNRDDFNRMIRRCRQKKIDLILTKSISRFARNTLDSLKYIRALKGMGIGIIFEKENINTLETDTELIITFMSAFAQSESESISANVRWGKRQSMKEGKASVNFKKLYGYYLDDEGNPQVNSDQAEAVRSIYDQYLQGASLRMIKLSLEGKAVPNPTGGAKWDISQIRSILGNEKYCGDVLMQKTFTQDCINKKVIKNTGQLPMYLIQNNHPAIVSREIYQAVQAEKTRRSASASPSKRTSSTGRSCYASKFALSERLVCGECGTLYRRCTWKRNGKTRIVWRCVSRLDYGTKYCHQSPTMDEEPLQQTIMAAINSVMDSKGIICSQITEAAVEETGILPNSTMTLGEINRRLEELETEFNILLQQPDSAVKNAARFGGIANEIASLKGQREKIAARLRKDQTVQLHVHTMEAALDGMSHLMQQWDEEMIRQLVHTVKVISADHIKVFLCNGIEIDQTVNP